MAATLYSLFSAQEKRNAAKLDQMIPVSSKSASQRKTLRKRLQKLGVAPVQFRYRPSVTEMKTLFVQVTKNDERIHYTIEQNSTYFCEFYSKGWHSSRTLP